jgi:Flp pilus assembly pilin Flp
MLRDILKTLRAEDGQALVEYALILALVMVVAVAVLSSVGGTVAGLVDPLVVAF